MKYYLVSFAPRPGISLRIMFLLTKKVVIVVLCRDASTFISGTEFRVCSDNGLFFSWNILKDNVFTYKKGVDRDVSTFISASEFRVCSERPKFNHEMDL